MDKLQIIKSIIDIHNYFQTNFFKNCYFLLMIEKCFGIKKLLFMTGILMIILRILLLLMIIS